MSIGNNAILYGRACTERGGDPFDRGTSISTSPQKRRTNTRIETGMVKKKLKSDAERKPGI